MLTDRHYMGMALCEARKGEGRTSPNPPVGAVVVRQGAVVGRGHHKKAGTPHAEIHALLDAGGQARGATIYVTLEPCNHTGRTPPCTEALLAAGISRVVIGSPDPNPNVAGGGAGYLASKGVDVESGIRETECRGLILPFIKHSSTGRPLVILKAGISLDGRIAAGSGQTTAVTGECSRREVHRMRDRVDAILVGSNTVTVDDPSLTTRLARPSRPTRDPLRVVVDTTLKMPLSARMLSRDSAAETWVFCGPEADSKKRTLLEKAGAKVIPVPLAAGGVDLAAVLGELGRAGICSLLVEGGGRVHGAFLQAGLADSVSLFVAPIFLGDAGVPVASFAAMEKHLPELRMKIHKTRRLGDDLLIQGIINQALLK